MFTYRVWAIALLLSSVTTALTAAEGMPETARARFEDLRLSTYVTASDVQTLASEAQARARMLEVLAGLGISKVYVEVYRGGVVLSEPDLV
ncbi:MAG: hypothetical protein HC888_14250, partial [Candidatus Competibacteraceae bacterium]|nr:hypothetical protein [Candidatus Competibacteraceae bacterium]